MNELDLGPLRVEAEENPGSSVAVLLAEVDRLRADLAAAQRERDALAVEVDAWTHEPEPAPADWPPDACGSCGRLFSHPRHKTAASIIAALPAGGTDRTGEDER